MQEDKQNQVVSKRNDRQTGSQPFRSGHLPTTMDIEPMNTVETRVKSPPIRARNQLHRQQRSKPTVGMHGCPPDQNQQPGRKAFREMPFGTGSTASFC